MKKKSDKKIVELDCDIDDIVYFSQVGVAVCAKITNISINIDKSKDESVLLHVIGIGGQHEGQGMKINSGVAYSNPDDLFESMKESFNLMLKGKGIKIEKNEDITDSEEQ